MKVFTQLLYLALICCLSTSVITSQIIIQEPLNYGVPDDWTAPRYAISTQDPCEGAAQLGCNLYGFLIYNSSFIQSPDYTSNGAEITYSFDYQAIPNAQSTVNGSIDAAYSTNQGVTWHTIESIGLSDMTDCTTYSTTIPAGTVANGANFRIRITSTTTSPDYNWYCFIDNISVVQPYTTSPSCTTLENPVNGAQNVSILQQLRWHESPGALGYMLTVGTTSGGSDVLDNHDVGDRNYFNFIESPLDGGTTYYVRIAPYNAIGTTSACKEDSFTTFTPPSNNDCENPMPLVLSNNAACANAVFGDTEYATISLQAHCLWHNRTLWYSFTPTKTDDYELRLDNVQPTSSAFINVWKGDCNSLEIISKCNYETISTLAFEKDSTYLISIEYYNTVQFNLCVYPTPRPNNDACKNATTVIESGDTMCLNAISGTLEYARPSASNTCSTFDIDVWYKFIPTTTGLYHLESKITNNVSGSSDLTVWEGNCDGLTKVNKNCNVGKLTYIPLVQGETYYISVSDSREPDFELCVYPSPPPIGNNTCGTATPLLVSNDTTCTNSITGTLEHATFASEISTPYSEYRDVWYTFQPPSNGKYSFICEAENGSSNQIRLNVSKGACGQFAYQYPGNARYDIPLMADTTYFIKVSTPPAFTATTFELCAYKNPPPPVNDECHSAIVINESKDAFCENGVSGTFRNATRTINFYKQILATTYRLDYVNVWYTFTPSKDGYYYYSTTNSDAYIDYWRGTCASLPPAIYTSSNTASKTYLLKDSTYIFIVSADRFATDYDFEFCIYPEQSPPPNDEPLSPIEIWNKRSPTVYNEVVYSESGGTSNLHSSCGNNTSLIDLWYSLDDLVPGDEITVTVEGDAYYDSVIELYEKDGYYPLTSISCQNATRTGGTEVLSYKVPLALLPGMSTAPSYLVQVLNDEKDPRPGTFKITASIKVNKLGPNKRAEPAVTDPGNIYFRVGQQVLNVYPVPTLDILQVQVASTEATDATLEILDLSGKVLHLENLRLEKGTYDYELDLSSLTNGTYLGRLNDQVFKVVVQK